MHKGVVQGLLPVSKDDGGDMLMVMSFSCIMLRSQCDWEREIPGIQRHQCTMIAFLS